MEKTIRVLNELVQETVLERYAIGGAIAALFYVEPFETHDLDVFVVLPPSQGPLLTLETLYAVLRAKGYVEHGEQILIEGVPVQFLVSSSPVVDEAMHHAMAHCYGAQTTNIFLPEYLLAIMAELDRPKDRIRIGMFLEQATIDRARLQEILQRHQLESRWKKILQALGYEE